MRSRVLSILHKNIYRNTPSKYCTILQIHRVSRYSDEPSPESPQQEPEPPEPKQSNKTPYFIAATIAAGGAAYAYYQMNSTENEPESDDKIDLDFDALFASKPVRKVLPSEIVGEIDLIELNKYNHSHPTRQLISIYGTIFDVTDAKEKYGKDGVYKMFAGHDITLALGSASLNAKYLDIFVKLDESKDKQFIESAIEWSAFYKKKYPVVGTLKKWNEDQSNWPELTEQQKYELTQFMNPH